MKKSWGAAGRWAALCLLLSVISFTRGQSPDRPFVLGRDSLAFANELVWTYEFGTNGSVKMRQARPAPDFPLRCFPMTRATREFFYHARFAPDQPKVGTKEYRALVRQVMGRNSRCPSEPGERIVIPGYASLHELSSAHPDLVRSAIGGPLRSYLQRGNWRMIFPISRARYSKTAEELVKELAQGRLPIVHVYQFPNTTLNHALLIFSGRDHGQTIKFQAYDPNNPGEPARLSFDRAERTFLFERNRYFGGGPVRVYEVYRGLCY